MDEYIIRETEDFYPLSVLFHENGLGVAVEERMPDRVIKMWRMDDPQTGDIMAAVTFEMRDGVHTLGDIAVRSDLQCKGYGKVMQNLVFEEARKLGVREVWACAKEPDYYVHSGWQRMPWDTSPDIAVYCSICGKRGNICHPEKVRYTLED